MSFQDFLAAVDSAKLRAVLLHWESVRHGKRMPAWRDIDPTAIGRHLSIVWSWRYDRDADRFTGRLAGDDIIDAFGKNPRGRLMEEFFAPDHYGMIFARHKRVVTEPAFAHGTGPVFIHAARSGQGERIIMPLADDGMTGDGIFGATVYDIEGGRTREATAQGLVAEKVDFFPID